MAKQSGHVKDSSIQSPALSEIGMEDDSAMHDSLDPYSLFAPERDEIGPVATSWGWRHAKSRDKPGRSRERQEQAHVDAEFLSRQKRAKRSGSEDQWEQDDVSS
eukprot:9944995-Karenia_brevis.AAC.1